MPELIDRLKQRKLVQWGLAYLASAWVFLQVIDFIGAEFDWPGQVSRIALVMAGIGFLVVIVLAWYHGEHGSQQVTVPEIVIIASLLLIGGAAVASLDLDADVTAITAAPADSIAGIEERSLAVLPFTNLSEEKSNEYFSDGVTEEILNTVARLPGLRVASRTSSFSFKGQSVGLEQIAQRLRVAHVLEGSVRKFGQRVVISAKLIDTRRDRQIWSQDFDRDLEDVFAVQQEIARAIAGALELQFGGALAAGRPTENLQAHDAYLLGLDQWHRRTRGGMAESIRHFEAAIRQDSMYAEAWAALAQAYAVLPVYDSRIGQAEAGRRAQRAARRALALDSTMAHPHAAIGWVLSVNEWRWNEGIAELRRAVAKNPNDAISLVWLASILARTGQIEEALAHSEVAARLDPLSLPVHQQRAVILLQSSRNDQALGEFRLAHSIEPDNQIVLAYLTRFHLAQAAYDSAGMTLRRIAQLSDYGHPAETTEFVEAARAGQVERAGTLLTRWGEASFITNYHLASLHQLIGDRAGALRALERSFNRPEQVISSLKMDPAFASIRSDPKVTAMLRRMNLR